MAKKVAHSLRESEKKTRQVFKPILDNPYTQSNMWPFVEPKIGDDTLTLLEQILAPIGSYKQIVSDNSSNKSFIPPERPQIESHVTLGFNSTVKALENQACVNRNRVFGIKAKTEKPSRFVKYVFVARYDIMPAVLTSHLPVLAFTASYSPIERVKLVQLPKGAMTRLSKATGMKHLGIVGLNDDTSAAQSLFAMINNGVGDVDVPWLNSIFDSKTSMPFYMPPVKFLSTTAPVVSKKQAKKQLSEEPQSNKTQTKRQLSEEPQSNKKQKKSW